MRLTKHHALGNDFLVALVDTVPAGAAALALALCHRTRGVGADGLIFGTPPGNPAKADLTFTLHNADGSPAGVSGNGLRCLVQAVARRQGETTGSMRVATGDRIRLVDYAPGSKPAELRARVDMGAVMPGPALPAALPAVARLVVGNVGTGDVGNPHVVIEVADVAAVAPATDGAAVAAAWGGQINVHFLQPTGADTIRLVHYERGAGVTESCGSGALVSAHLAHQWGLSASTVTVDMPGGQATVELGETNWLTGPSVYIATIEIDHA